MAFMMMMMVVLVICSGRKFPSYLVSQSESLSPIPNLADLWPEA